MKRINLLGLLAFFVAVNSVRAEIDLTPVTTGLTGLGTAVLGVCGAMIAAAMGLMAIKFGGKWVMKLWKSFTG